VFSVEVLREGVGPPRRSTVSQSGGWLRRGRCGECALRHPPRCWA
jgi:hypothetical protein